MKQVELRHGRHCGELCAAKVIHWQLTRRLGICTLRDSSQFWVIYATPQRGSMVQTTVVRYE